MHRSFLLPLFLFATTLHAQQWNWATSGGGTSNDDHCYAIGTDSEGNLYYAGTTRGSNGQFACGPVSVGATTAAVLAKYTVDGQCVWLRTITVPSFDARAYAIAIDAQDRIYLAGSYRGTATFGDGISLASYSSSTNIFLARYDTAGTCLWARRAGGAFSTSVGQGLAVHEDGSIFLVGHAGGDPVHAGSLQLANPGNGRQVFLARYDSTGAVQWARISSGGDIYRSGRAISIQGDRLFLTGQANYSLSEYDDLPLANTATSGNLYVLACDLDGNGIWSSVYSGMSDVEGTGIAADSLGNLFVVGRLWGSLHLPDDTLQSMSSDDDILLLGLDQEGGHRWGHSAGSAERDLAWGVVADGMGNAYVAMQFEQTMELLGQSLTALGGEDALILKVTAQGASVWTSRPSGHQRDIPLCIHRHHAPPHRLAFGGYFWGTITHGSSTITDVQNGDGMLVSGIDTTFHVNTYAAPTCGISCDGTAYAFAQGAAPFTYAWNTGDTTAVLTGSCPGTYTVQVTDANSAVQVAAVTVPSLPDPVYTINMQGDSLWVDGGHAWQWFMDGGTLVGENAWVLATAPGSYHALVTGAGGCAWSTDTVAVIPTFAADIWGNDQPRIRPNPVRGMLYIDMPADLGLGYAELLNSVGAQVMTFTLAPGVNVVDIDGLPSGLYILRCSGSGGWRVMVE